MNYSVQRQLSVAIENQPGRLAAITRLMGTQSINIKDLSVIDNVEQGMIRLVTSDPVGCKALLIKEGFYVVEADVLGVYPEGYAGAAFDPLPGPRGCEDQHRLRLWKRGCERGNGPDCDEGFQPGKSVPGNPNVAGKLKWRPRSRERSGLFLPARCGVSLFYHLTRQLEEIDGRIFFMERKGSTSMATLRSKGELLIADARKVHHVLARGLFKPDIVNSVRKRRIT